MNPFVAALRDRLLRGGGAVIRNLYRSQAPKRALLSYITSPFHRPARAPRHTNATEARVWAEVLHARGYRVDVVEFTEPRAIGPDEAYDVVCGFGHPFESCMRHRRHRPTRFIFYGTGCHPYFSDRATTARLIDFHASYGVWPEYGGREMSSAWPFQWQAADHYVVLGDAFVESTYRQHILRGTTHRLAAFPLATDAADLGSARIARRRENLLWFGSDGGVHKGLSLVIEALRELPDVQLHIAGLARREAKALGIPRLVPEVADRVHHHGVLRPGTAAFRQILRSSGMTILPSASEGGSPSMITAVACQAGLPIVSRETGVGFGGHEERLSDCRPASIVRAVRAVMALNPAAYQQRLSDAQRYVASTYNVANYRESLMRHLDDIGV